MATNPFLLRTPTDMLAKAKHDLGIMKAYPSAYTIFNFFVTAYHVMDYVRKTNAAPQLAIDAMYADADFEQCNTICNTAKHLELDKTKKKTPKVLKAHQTGGAMPGRMMLGTADCRPGSAPRWQLLCDGTEIDHNAVADRVIAKWEAFFVANRIT